LVAGALSMAAGEYVSVSSQRDAEQADIDLEGRELRRDPEGELTELAGIYEHRGLAPALASEVALNLSRHGALEAHTRDELGLDQRRRGAAVSGRVDVGAVVRRGRGAAVAGRRDDSTTSTGGIVVVVTLIALGLLGDLGARLGGAPRRHATIRVVAWGAIAMAITAGIGALVGAVAPVA
jgi:vacuolar iron transporter family protein